jgi:ribosomal protein L11 methyltransferase
MFCPLEWFSHQQILGRLRKELLDWAKNGQKCFYLTTDKTPLTPEIRTLKDEDIQTLKNQIDFSWFKYGYGGFTCGSKLSDITGFCYFGLNEDKTSAELNGFVFEAELAEIPFFQSPLLRLALLELLENNRELKEIILPDIEYTPSDQAFLGKCKLAPSDKPGLWKRANVRTEKSLQDNGATENPPSWLELTLEVDPGIFTYVRQLCAFYTYEERLQIERATLPNPEGRIAIDESANSIIHTYLLNDAQLPQKQNEFRYHLTNLSYFHPLNPVTTKEITLDDWAEVWQDFNLHRVGKKIVITEEYAIYKPKEGEIVIDLAPSPEAFGLYYSSLHPSTVGILEMIEEHFNSQQHQKVVDVGIGAGILTIAAARLGAKEILGLDAAIPAIKVAKENIARNKLPDTKFIVEHGSLLPFKSNADEGIYVFKEEDLQPPAVLAEMLPFDIAFCNTYPHVIINLAQALKDAIRPGGLLLCSGIRLNKTTEVMEALEAVGLEMVEGTEVKGWSTLVHRRPE